MKYPTTQRWAQVIAIAIHARILSIGDTLSLREQHVSLFQGVPFFFFVNPLYLAKVHVVGSALIRQDVLKPGCPHKGVPLYLVSFR